MEKCYKKYTLQARMCIKGEAFFESLISEYAIPHHIISPKDIGIDYLCEWIYGDKPTGILFAVQIKTLSVKNAKPKFINVADKYNGLKTFTIRNNHLIFGKNTLQYWHGLGLPVYVFTIIQQKDNVLDCYYKRYTQLLTENIRYANDCYFNKYYKVNDGNLFIAFKDNINRKQGFVRDLFVDHVRWCYYKGNFTYLSPDSLGLNQFKADDVFVDLFDKYKTNIWSVYSRMHQYFKNLKTTPANPY